MAKGSLHQLLAVKKGLAQRANEIFGETATILKKVHFFQGSLKTYQHFDEAEAKDVAVAAVIPAEKEPLGYTVKDKLTWFTKEYGRLVDVDYQIDKSNKVASGSIQLDGLELTDIPASFLLDLIGHLTKLRVLYGGIPVLDPKHNWDEAPGMGKGVFAAQDDEVTYRTRKAPKHEILYDATPEHPAQIEKWHEDVRIGKYTKKLWSGALTVNQKSALLQRLDKLLEAAKISLSKANEQEHSTEKISTALFAWIHKDPGSDKVGA